MPFVSQDQSDACFSGAIPGVDCHEWAKKTNYSTLPKNKRARRKLARLLLAEHDRSGWADLINDRLPAEYYVQDRKGRLQRSRRPPTSYPYFVNYPLKAGGTVLLEVLAPGKHRLVPQDASPVRMKPRGLFETGRQMAGVQAGWHDQLPGGLADQRTPEDFDPRQLSRGMKVEQEHTNDPHVQQEITMDHLVEDPNYYPKLTRMERQARRQKLAARLAGWADEHYEKLVERQSDVQAVPGVPPGGTPHHGFDPDPAQDPKKVQMYRNHQFSMPVPPHTTDRWDEAAWIRFIDRDGQWHPNMPIVNPDDDAPGAERPPAWMNDSGPAQDGRAVNRYEREAGYKDDLLIGRCNA